MKEPVLREVGTFNHLKKIKAFLAAPRNLKEIHGTVEYARAHSLTICPMGGGYSLGDAFLNTDNVVLSLNHYNKILDADWENGLITVESGIRQCDILSESLTRGWYLPSMPGSPYSQVGGAIACDSHGKDSWLTGNFGNNLVYLKLLTADGQIIQLNNDSNDSVFNATIGGLGLTGIITEITLKLKRIPSAWVKRKAYKIENFYQLESGFQKAIQNDFQLLYSWVDIFSKNGSIGKGMLEKAKFIDDTQPINKKAITKFKQKNNIFYLKPELFWYVFKKIWSPYVLKSYNKSKFYLNSFRTSSIEPYLSYQFEFFELPKANMMFAPKGGIDFQSLFPAHTCIEAFSMMIETCQKHKHFPKVCAVKKHKSSSSYLSFSGDGFSISIDITFGEWKKHKLEAFIRELLEIVVKYEGKMYLAKSPFLLSHEFKQMYPTYLEFLNVKKMLDPDNFFWSDTAERILK